MTGYSNRVRHIKFTLGVTLLDSAQELHQGWKGHGLWPLDLLLTCKMATDGDNTAVSSPKVGGSVLSNLTGVGHLQGFRQLRRVHIMLVYYSTANGKGS